MLQNRRQLRDFEILGEYGLSARAAQRMENPTLK
jgi:hypothetical protein